MILVDGTVNPPKITIIERKGGRPKKEENMKVGQRVKKIRKSLGLTQREFANRIPRKIDYTYIGKIERGHQYPSLKLLERIGATFSKPMSYFFRDEDQPIIYEKAQKMSWRVKVVVCLLSNYRWSLGWFYNCYSCHLKQRELCQKVKKAIEEG